MTAATGTTRPDVACVGDNCVDLVSDRDGAEMAGGNALNVAVELARAGLATGYFGAVGHDDRGAMILAAARQAGVDVQGVLRADGPTGVTVVGHDAGGERLFVEEDYGVAADYRLDAAAAGRVGNHRWAHFARQPDFADWAPGLRAGGTRLSYDFGETVDPAVLGSLGHHLDVGFLSEPTGDPRTAEPLLALALESGAPLAVVTLGAAGSMAATPRRRWRQPAVPVAEILDTLGAGDAFIAAFISTMLDSDDVHEALQRGAHAGALACTRIGLASPPAATEVPA